MSLKKLFSVLLSVCAVLSVSFCVHADSVSRVPYPNYTYWTDAQTYETKAVFVPERQLMGAEPDGSGFASLEYVVAYGEELYILDGGAGRIYVMDTQYRLKRTISEFSSADGAVTFQGATGLFADAAGLYIADTEHKRVICTDGTSVVQTITMPESSLIPENYDFAPIRLVRDSNGYLYVLCKGSYYGMMLFSDEYEFLGFYGANKVEVSFTDAITNLITSLFETEEKHNASVQALPFQLIDIALDSEGFITTISDQSRGQIKRFGANGTNNLVYSDQFAAVNGDNINFADQPLSYQDKSSRYGTYITERMVAVTTDSDGYIYAVDTAQGRIFMYDTECRLICVIGGGLGAGTQCGTFVSPNAAACFGGDLLVSDLLTGKVTVFALTDYGKALKTANRLTIDSNYQEAAPYWRTILQQDKNCQLAYQGLAKAALENGDYHVAMDYAEQGLDRVTYASAFKYVRNNFIAKNFIWIGAIVLLLAGGSIYFIRLTRKKEIVLIRNQKIRTGMTACIHPFRSFQLLKNHGQTSVLLATVLLALYYIFTVTGELNGGFMYTTADVNSFNALYTFLGTVGIVLIYTLMNWAISVLFSGRGTLKEIYCATCYCLTPMIIYQILYLALSHLVVATSNGGFGMLGTVFELYTIILILISMTAIHDFTFFKAIGIAVATVLGMCIIAFIIFIMLSLGQNIVNFIVSMINEISLR